MRTHSTLLWLSFVVVLARCGAVNTTCEQTCGGCCQGEVCMPGSSRLACGFAGRQCDVCVGAQTCAVGQCAFPAVGGTGVGTSGGGGGGGGNAGGGAGGAVDGGIALLPVSAFDGTCESVNENLRRCGMASSDAPLIGRASNCTLGDFLRSQQCVDGRFLRLPYDRVALGGACTNDPECGAHAYCEADICPGRCVAKKPIGARALRLGECESGVLALQHCAAVPPLGISCSSQEMCPLGAVCASNGSCSAFHVVELGAVCDAGALCRGGACNWFGRCAPLAKEGESCRSVDCRRGLDCLGDTCVVNGCALCDGRCVDRQCLPLIERGGVCESSQDCVASDFCDGANECSARLPVGSECNDWRTCADGLGCSSSSGLCQVPRRNIALGVWCASDRECASGACSRERCVAVAPVGSPCSDNRICTPGAFCDTTTFTCQPRRGVGLECTISDECQHDCTDGSCTWSERDCIIP